MFTTGAAGIVSATQLLAAGAAIPEVCDGPLEEPLLEDVEPEELLEELLEAPEELDVELLLPLDELVEDPEPDDELPELLFELLLEDPSPDEPPLPDPPLVDTSEESELPEQAANKLTSNIVNKYFITTFVPLDYFYCIF